MSYKPLNKDTEKEKANKKQLVESNILAENTNVVKYLLTNRSYWMFLVIMMITNFTYYIPIVHLVSFDLTSTSKCRKMVRHTLKILQQMLEDFKSVSDHFTTLRSKGLIHFFSLI